MSLPAQRQPLVRLGIEVAMRDPPAVLQGAVGLVTNHTGVDSQLRSDIELLNSLPGVRLHALFGPEHGLWGEAQAGEPVEASTDPISGAPVYSLYGPVQKPTPDMLAGLSVLVIDLQDAGARYWTYIYTMARCIQAAGERGIPVVVLDRPNPIGGTRMEGNIQEEDFLSGVGLYPLPNRHGLTMGELARHFNATYGFDAELTVVPCEGWRRDMLLWDTGLPYVPGSPNTPTLESLLLYPGTCLFEGTTLSEGRGTTKPFEVIGAPWVNPFALASTLNALGLTGVRFRPTHFVPTFSKHQGELCRGVQVHVTDSYAVDAVGIGVHVITALRRLFPRDLVWRPPLGVGGRYFIDLLSGCDSFRQAVDDGAEAAEILASWGPARQAFQTRCHEALLYHS
jgi:uncharacterized protein YbbC (DUF1343 family)